MIYQVKDISGYVRVCVSVRGFARMHAGVRSCAQGCVVWAGVAGCAQVCVSVHWCALLYAGVCGSVWVSASVCVG